MAKVYQNISLKEYNTFGIDVKAKFLCEYEKPSDLKNYIENGPLLRDEKMIILGGGSNILFTEDFNGVILHPINTDIQILKEDEDYVYLKAGAGLDWDEFVAYAVDKGWGGIENLSDIPGNIGAVPVQNIGAYGVEAKETVHEVHLVSFHDGSERSISNAECEFGYRMSAFKKQLKNRYLVDSVTFKLNKKPTFVLHYGSVKQALEHKEISLSSIRETIMEIRGSKLPDPENIGNAGSFFKNPVIPNIQAEALLKQYPDMVNYPAEKDMTKLAAGWLIDQCGLKGYVNSNKTAGIHNKQALVIVNHNNAGGTEIQEVAQLAQQKVFEKFQVCLEPEVLIL